MKRYIAPEMKIKGFSKADVITASDPVTLTSAEQKVYDNLTGGSDRESGTYIVHLNDIATKE